MRWSGTGCGWCSIAEPDLRVVAEAGDGVEVLDVARRAELDLAILDVSMPRMTGLQAARGARVVASGAACADAVDA